jgi:hypothetical protein
VSLANLALVTSRLSVFAIQSDLLDCVTAPTRRSDGPDASDGEYDFMAEITAARSGA